MRSIVNSTFVSLDGVINHMGGWHFDFVDDDISMTLGSFRRLARRRQLCAGGSRLAA